MFEPEVTNLPIDGAKSYGNCLTKYRQSYIIFYCVSTIEGDGSYVCHTFCFSISNSL